MLKFFRKMRLSTKVMLGILLVVVLAGGGFGLWAWQTGKLSSSADVPSNTITVDNSANFAKDSNIVVDVASQVIKLNTSGSSIPIESSLIDILIAQPIPPNPAWGNSPALQSWKTMPEGKMLSEKSPAEIMSILSDNDTPATTYIKTSLIEDQKSRQPMTFAFTPTIPAGATISSLQIDLTQSAFANWTEITVGEDRAKVMSNFTSGIIQTCPGYGCTYSGTIPQTGQIVVGLWPKYQGPVVADPTYGLVKLKFTLNLQTAQKSGKVYQPSAINDIPNMTIPEAALDSAWWQTFTINNVSYPGMGAAATIQWFAANKKTDLTQIDFIDSKNCIGICSEQIPLIAAAAPHIYSLSGFDGASLRGRYIKFVLKLNATGVSPDINNKFYLSYDNTPQKICPTAPSIAPETLGIDRKITINGTDFSDTTGTAWLRQGGAETKAGDLTILTWSDTQITGTVPANVMAGTYRVYVAATNCDPVGSTNTLTIAFAAPPPPTTGTCPTSIKLTGDTHQNGGTKAYATADTKLTLTDTNLKTPGTIVMVWNKDTIKYPATVTSWNDTLIETQVPGISMDTDFWNSNFNWLKKNTLSGIIVQSQDENLYDSSMGFLRYLSIKGIGLSAMGKEKTYHYEVTPAGCPTIVSPEFGYLRFYYYFLSTKLATPFSYKIE